MLEKTLYIEAINKYKEIIKVKPDYIPVLQKIVHTYTQNNDFKQAVAVYEHIIKLKPNQDKAYAKLARLQAKQNSYRDAIAKFKKAISIRYNQPDWVFIGLADVIKKAKSQLSD